MEITRGLKTLRQNTKHAPFSTKLVSSETNSLAVIRLWSLSTVSLRLLTNDFNLTRESNPIEITKVKLGLD